MKRRDRPVIFHSQPAEVPLPRAIGRPLARVEQTGLALCFDGTPWSISEVMRWQAQHAGQKFALLALPDAPVRITFEAQLGILLRQLLAMHPTDRARIAADSIAALQRVASSVTP